jgi:AcrR family transcriptional regulator
MNGMNQEDARIAYQAGDLFHQHGITATGVEALSKAAGISKRTHYESFGSKDGLIAAACSKFATCFRSRSTPARSSARAVRRASS